MVNSLIITQETIASIQERLEIWERCLNEANAQNEAMVRIVELANIRQVSFNQLQEELRQFREKSDKFKCLIDEFIRKLKQGELAVLLFVRYNFILKEIVDKYGDFLVDRFNKEAPQKLTIAYVNFYKEIQKQSDSEISKEDKYIVIDTLKYVINSLFKVDLQVKALSEEKIKAMNLGDITPKESEAMLISLASMKKWDWVYRNLA